MDPNLVLQDIRKALREGDVEMAAFLFEGLDDWLSRGGFLPPDWLPAARNY